MRAFIHIRLAPYDFDLAHCTNSGHVLGDPVLEPWSLVSGVDFLLLKEPSRSVPHLDDNLFTSLQSFLASVHGSLKVAPLQRPVPLRQGDLCLMTTVIALPQCKPAQLKAFNRCRLFLHITYLSQIASTCGCFILRSSWQGSDPCPSPSLWPYQPWPGHHSFSVWRHLLATAFLSGTHCRVSACTKDLSLPTPLGNWLPYSPGFCLQGSSFYNPSSNALLLATDSSYTCHPVDPKRKTETYYL